MSSEEPATAAAPAEKKSTVWAPDFPTAPCDLLKRYAVPHAVYYFSDAMRLALSVQAEVALTYGLSRLFFGEFPSDAMKIMEGKVADITQAEVTEVEKRTHHDIMALVHVITSRLTEHPEIAKYVHFGATSQDINDTQMALSTTLFVHRELLPRAEALRVRFREMAARYANVPTVARTHGQHAIPTTVGYKFAAFAFELEKAMEPLTAWCGMAKFAGAVGTHAMLGCIPGQNVEAYAIGYLQQKHGLDDTQFKAALFATQVVTRVPLASLVAQLAIMVGVIERFATEVRILQRTEIGEWAEAFDERAQVGSSTMPQKRNPHRSERLCGAARLVDGCVGPALRTIPLEGERDLTNSIVERVNMPIAADLTLFMVHECDAILAGLVIDEQRCAENLRMTGAHLFAERIMGHLTLYGDEGRQEAHEIVRRMMMTIPSDDHDAAYRELCRIFPDLTPKKYDAFIDPKTYLGSAVQRVCQWAECDRAATATKQQKE